MPRYRITKKSYLKPNGSQTSHLVQEGEIVDLPEGTEGSGLELLDEPEVKPEPRVSAPRAKPTPKITRPAEEVYAEQHQAEAEL